MDWIGFSNLQMGTVEGQLTTLISLFTSQFTVLINHLCMLDTYNTHPGHMYIAGTYTKAQIP